jgi:hypothetical protein
MLNEFLDFMKSNIEIILSPSPSAITGRFSGHEIIVSFDHKKMCLYIDNELAESTRTYLWPQKDAALLRGAIKEGEVKHMIHVYGRSSLLKAKIKICVDGERIAGDDF